MAKNRNKVKFGLNNVHWAKIVQWGADPDGTPTVPVYGESVRLPGAVSLSIDANGENENFFLPTTAFITSSTTIPVMRVTSKSLLLQQSLPLKFWEKSLTTTEYLWRKTTQSRHSLH